MESVNWLDLAPKQIRQTFAPDLLTTLAKESNLPPDILWELFQHGIVPTMTRLEAPTKLLG